MKAFKSLILLLILFVVEGFSVLSAQNRTVSGKVFDTQQEALVGVTIQLSGTTQGTVTAADGSFSLLVPSEAVVLNISYVGYLTQKVNVAPDQKDINVYMQEDVILMNETVVIGYGTQKKVNLTGAVSTVERQGA